MSSFSGLSTALSALTAQRQVLEVAGQNIANANTVGYTRQRANLNAVGGTAVPSLFSNPVGAGSGVRLDSVQRLNDAFLETRVRTQTATASYLGVRAEAYNRLEVSLGEPKETGLAANLDDLWGAWQDVANTPDETSSRQVLIEQSKTVASQLHTLYDNVQVQWTQAYTATSAMVEDVNTTAKNIADLNGRIQSVENAGGNANELVDQRDLLVTHLSNLTGATMRKNDNGSVDVMVSGNLLVSGSRSQSLALVGASKFAEATGDATTPGLGLDVVWADNPSVSASLSGGRIAGNLTVLAPPNSTGTGGILTEAAARIDTVATTLAQKVNALHGTAVDLDGNPGEPFFTFTPGVSPAAGIQVAISDPRKVATADPTKGALDGSVADQIGKIGDDKSGPGALWSAAVVEIGVRTASEGQRATVAESTRRSAEQLHLAATSVDIDSENVDMLAAQRAYQGASRVITVLDELLDTLINRTAI